MDAVLPSKDTLVFVTDDLPQSKRSGIRHFVREGGLVIFLNASADGLLKRYGIMRRPHRARMHLAQYPDYVVEEALVNHSLTARAPALVVPRAHTLFQPTLTPLYSSDAERQSGYVLLAKVGKGQVIAMASSHPLTEPAIQFGPHRELALALSELAHSEGRRAHYVDENTNLIGGTRLSSGIRQLESQLAALPMLGKERTRIVMLVLFALCTLAFVAWTLRVKKRKDRPQMTANALAAYYAALRTRKSLEGRLHRMEPTTQAGKELKHKLISRLGRTIPTEHPRQVDPLGLEELKQDTLTLERNLAR